MRRIEELMAGALSMRGRLLVMVCILALTGGVMARIAWFSSAPDDPAKAPSPRPAAPGAAESLQSAVASAPSAPPAAPAGRPYLGIRGEVFKTGSLTGLRVLEVFPDSPAAMAGLRSKYDPRRTGGDLITRVNDRPVQSEGDLKRLLENSTPGQVITLLVTSESGNAFEIVPVTLGAAPITPADAGVVDPAQVKEVAEQAAAMNQLEQAIFAEVNRVRLELGVAALRGSALLQRAARSHSEQMLSGNFFSHIDKNGQDVVDRLRVQGMEEFRSAGENIYMGRNISNLVESVVQGWLQSPGHRKNLLSPNYQETGVGIAMGDRGKVYVTQVYIESF